MTKGETVLRAEPGTQEVLITREFNAPRELVFKAFTDPKLYVQWLLGPKEQGLVMRLDKFVPKAGGEWRFIYTDREGNEKFGFHGSYHEVLSPERIIDTFEIEGLAARTRRVGYAAAGGHEHRYGEHRRHPYQPHLALMTAILSGRT